MFQNNCFQIVKQIPLFRFFSGYELHQRGSTTVYNQECTNSRHIILISILTIHKVSHRSDHGLAPPVDEARQQHMQINFLCYGKHC